MTSIDHTATCRETDRASAFRALERARPVLRDLLRSDVECAARFIEGQPQLAELSPVDRAWLQPTLKAVQAVEAVIGRAEEEPHRKIAWLDRLIEQGLPARRDTA